MPGRTDIEARNARREVRYPTKVDGSLIVDRRRIAVQIADLSCAGACVRGTGLPTRGQEAVLQANGLEVVATIVWSGEGACGLNFHKAIAPLAVVRQNPFLPNLNTLTKGTAMRG